MAKKRKGKRRPRYVPISRYEDEETEAHALFNALSKKTLKALDVIQQQFPVDSGGRLELLLAMIAQPNHKEAQEWNRSLAAADFGLKNANRPLPQLVPNLDVKATDFEVWDDIDRHRKHRKALDKRDAQLDMVIEKAIRHAGMH